MFKLNSKIMGLATIDGLSENDWNFVKILTKVSKVHVLSHQVTLTFRRSGLGIGTDERNKLIFPQNWSLQHVGIELSKYEDSHSVIMTWEVLKP